MFNKSTSLLLLILFAFQGFAQNYNNEVYTIVETMPVFPGGEEAFIEYMKKAPVSDNIKNLNEKVFVKFLIDTVGDVESAWIESNLISTKDKAPIIEYVINMPQWTPGKQRGKEVFIQYVWPLNTFKQEPEVERRRKKRRR